MDSIAMQGQAKCLPKSSISLPEDAWQSAQSTGSLDSRISQDVLCFHLYIHPMIFLPESIKLPLETNAVFDRSLLVLITACGRAETHAVQQAVLLNLSLNPTLPAFT